MIRSSRKGHPVGYRRRRATAYILTVILLIPLSLAAGSSPAPDTSLQRESTPEWYDASELNGEVVMGKGMGYGRTEALLSAIADLASGTSAVVSSVSSERDTLFSHSSESLSRCFFGGLYVVSHLRSIDSATTGDELTILYSQFSSSTELLLAGVDTLRLTYYLAESMSGFQTCELEYSHTGPGLRLVVAELKNAGISIHAEEYQDYYYLALTAPRELADSMRTPGDSLGSRR